MRFLPAEHHLRHHHQFASFCVHRLHHAGHAHVAHRQALDVPQTADRGDALVGQREEDVGLGLWSSL